MADEDADVYLAYHTLTVVAVVFAVHNLPLDTVNMLFYMELIHFLSIAIACIEHYCLVFGQYSGGEVLSLFVIADLHLSLSADKPMDIFSGWTDHVARLEKNWQERVEPDDTVVIPGDISWAMSLSDALEDFKFIDRLNGHKIIVKGNHDYWWSTVSKAERLFRENGIGSINILHNNFYRFGDNIGICGTRGWINDGSEPKDRKVILREAQRLERSVGAAVSVGCRPVAFLHYPPIFMDDRNDEIMDVLKKRRVRHCFCGHLHGYAHKCAFIGEFEGIEFRLISSDFLHFCPLDITNLVESNEKQIF